MKRRRAQRAGGASRPGGALRGSIGMPGDDRDAAISASVDSRGSARLTDRLLALVLVVYLALAIGYNLAMPVGGAPDEGAHAEFVRIVAEDGRLPVLDLRTSNNAQDPNGYEAHQPPLYYVLAAPAWRLARALGGGAAARARAARSVSTLIGLAGILLIWLFARLVVGPSRPWLTLSAATFAALLPMRLSLAAAVSNDTLAEATSTGVLCLLLLGLRRGYSTRLAFGAGAALGVAILAKASNLLLAPIVFAGIAVASQPRIEASEESGSRPAAEKRAGFDLRLLARNAGLAALGMIAVSGWWFARNQLLYHDLLMENTFRKKFAGALSAGDAVHLFGCPDVGSYLTGLVLPTTFQTFWGALGHLTAKGFMGVLPRGSFSAVPGWLAPVLGLLTFGALPPRQPVA